MRYKSLAAARKQPPSMLDTNPFGSTNQRIISAIFLDPSINETGWSIYRRGDTASGVIRTKGDTVEQKLYSLKVQLEDLLIQYSPAWGLVEYPPPFTYSRSTSKENGQNLNLESLIKLSLATGVCLSSCIATGAITERILATWKGGEVNKKWSQAVTGKTNHNEGDACLLRMWFLGRNNPVKKSIVARVTTA